MLRLTNLRNELKASLTNDVEVRRAATKTTIVTIAVLFAFLVSSLPVLALSNPSRTSLEATGFRPQATVTTSEQHFYIKDHLGSTMILTDSTGEPVLDLNYEAYGEHYEVSPTTNQAVADANNFLYTRQQLDKDIGQYYLRARFYDAKLGHFTVRDPIRTQGGINMYAYVNGNPINFVDPSGLSPNLGSIRDDLNGVPQRKMTPEEDKFFMDIIKPYPPISGADAAYDLYVEAMSEEGMTLEDLSNFAAQKLIDRLGAKIVKPITKGLKKIKGGRGRFKRGADSQRQFEEIQDAQSRLRKGK